MLLPLSAIKPYFYLRDSTLYGSAVFGISRLFTEVKTSSNDASGWKKWDKIADGGKNKGSLYLGKVPTNGALFGGSNQHEQIIEFVNKNENNKHPLGLVVSVIDPFDLSGATIVKPAAWEEKNIDHFLLPIADFTAKIPSLAIINTIETINDYIESGYSVYVHCKAGRSRSLMICVIYDWLYGNGNDLKPHARDRACTLNDIELIEDSIKNNSDPNYRRKQVGMNMDQKKKAVKVINLMNIIHLWFYGNNNQLKPHTLESPCTVNEIEKIKEFMGFDPLECLDLENESPTPALLESIAKKNQKENEKIAATINFLRENFSTKMPNSLQGYLSSLQLKNALLQMFAIKNLIIFAGGNQNIVVGQSKETKFIKEFLCDIYEAKNEKWYLNLISNQGPLEKLIQSTQNENQKNCKVLREQLIDSINFHLAKTFKCTVDDIQIALQKLLARQQEKNSLPESNLSIKIKF